MDLSKIQEMMIRIAFFCILMVLAAGAQLPDQQIQNLLLEAQRCAQAKNVAYAEGYCQQAVTLAERAYGRTDARLVPMLEQVFRLHETLEDYPRAEQDRLRILTLVSRGRNPSDPVIAHERVRLANYLATQSRFAACNAQFEQAIAALSRDPFNQTSELPHVLELYAQALELQGRNAEAAEMRNRAEKSREKRF